MKIILSRKGFDSSNGGYPSPILPDGTLLSMPIPSGDEACYGDLRVGDQTCADILQQLIPKGQFSHCHVDPDLRADSRVNMPENWKPAFGQVGAAQGLLSNAGVGPGDLFLFFGWFRRAEKSDGRYRFVPKSSGNFYDHADLHVIYGYMQIGAVLTDPEEIAGYPWHPHAGSAFLERKTNALYLPSEELSFAPGRKGWGTLDFRQDRVLTMEGRNRGTWRELPFLMPEHIYGNKKNSARDGGLYYAGIWQELVVCESEELMDWVRQILL